MTDPYLDPRTGILRNLPGARTQTELDNIERSLSSARLQSIGAASFPRTFDLDHLQAIHHYIFQDVYDWAGQVRTIDISLDERFCPTENITPFAADVFQRLHHDDLLRGRGQEEFIRLLASYLGDVNALHPFRDGNGRTQREFFGQLAEQAGYRLDWARTDKKTNERASRQSLRGDNSGLERMLNEVVAPSRKVVGRPTPEENDERRRQ